jgi:LacI family transcriptional regulator
VKKKVSLKDIAQQAGVSIALVSYVLNNKEKESRVGKEMAAKIRQIAQELDYQPNQIAKSLKSGKTYTIGLIVADISNPFFATLARIIEDEAKKNHYTVIFGSSDEKADKAWDLIHVLINRQVDGFIMVPSEAAEEQVRYLKKQNIPLVLIDRYFPEIPSSYLAIDNFRAAYDACTRLIQTGHTRIGMMAYRTKLFHMQERIRGYQEALRDQGLPSDVNRLREARYSHVQDDVAALINELTAPEVASDALFFATNTLAINGLKHINRLRLRVPTDLAIVSFDEGEAFDFYYCPLTYVQQPVADMGKGAVQLLLEMMTNKNTSARSVLLDAQLIVRQSCGTQA